MFQDILAMSNNAGGTPELVWSIENQASGTQVIDTGITIESNKTYFCFGTTTRTTYNCWDCWAVIQNGAILYSGQSGYQNFLIDNGKIKLNVTASSSVPTWYLYDYIYGI